MRVSVWMAALAGVATLVASLPASAQIGPNNSQADTMGRRMIPQGGPGGGFGNRGGFHGNPGGFGGNRGGFNRGGFGRGGYAGGYRHHDRGIGVGAGIAGLAAGALIGGAIASQSGPGYGYGYGYDGGYADPGYAPDYGYAQPGPGYAYAPAAAPSDDGGQEAYCAQRYKSYDPSSGTFLGYDGARHPCP